MEAYIETPRLVLRGFCLQDAQSMFDSYSVSYTHLTLTTN